MFILFAQAADVATKAVEKVAEKVAEKAAEAAPKAVEAAEATATAAATAAEAVAPWYQELAASGALGCMIRGGLFMWPLLFMGVIAAGVIIERFRSLQMLRTDTSALRKQVRELLADDQIEEALAVCEREQGPIPAVLSAGLRKYLVLRKLGYDAGRIEEQVLKAMEGYAVHVVAALEKHLPILATVSSAAPMVGFLGTVQGMIVSFADIVASLGIKNIVAAAAAGIEVALYTTAFGLIVGIPAYVAFNYFTGVVNRYVLDVEETATELIEAVTLKMAMTNLEESASDPARVS